MIHQKILSAYISQIRQIYMNR